MGSKQGGQGATIYSVAERAGVSIASVSRVLQGSTAVSEKTRAKVLAAVEELNYVPLGAARSLAVRQHEAVGLVLPELTGPYYAELLLGFETRAAELGQSVLVLLSEGKRDLAHAVRQLATRVDGLAMLGSAAIPDPVVHALRGWKPVVVIAGDAAPDVEAVGAENDGERPEAHGPPHGPRSPAPALRRRPRLRPRLPRPLPRLRRGPPRQAPPRRGAGAHPVPRGGRRGVRRAPAGGGVRGRRPRVRQRRARPVDHDHAPGRRPGRARRHRGRRLGRRDDRPLRPTGPDDGAPAGPRARVPSRQSGCTSGSRACPRREGLEVLPTEVVLRSSCGCPGPATTPSHAPRPVRAHSRSPSRSRAHPPGPQPARAPPRPRKRRETGHETHLRHSGRHPDDHRPRPVRLRSRQRLRRCRATEGKSVSEGKATGTITVWAMGAEGEKLPGPRQGVRGRQPGRQGQGHRHPVGCRPRQVHDRDHGQPDARRRDGRHHLDGRVRRHRRARPDAAGDRQVAVLRGRPEDHRGGRHLLRHPVVRRDPPRLLPHRPRQEGRLHARRRPTGRA